MSTYQIIDEPKGSSLSKITVDPMWPLLSFMFGGALFSWAWSALNCLALNSPNRNKELMLIGAGFVAFILMYLGLGALLATQTLDSVNPQYIRMIIICVELAFVYKIYLTQQSSFSVYEYFNGKVANPVIGLFLALFVGKGLEAAVITLLLAGMA
ncbi:MAG: hypothetical protein ACPH9N_06640 [Alteromonas sp.]